VQWQRHCPDAGTAGRTPVVARSQAVIGGRLAVCVLTGGTTSVPRPVAVVSGAARGIGLATARRLNDTHRVALVDLDGDGARAAAAALGTDAIAAACDITDADSVRAAVGKIVDAAGGIDVVISNAGISTGGALRHLDPDVLAAQLNVNLTGNWRFIHACLPHVIDRRGYVLAVASAAAVLGSPGLGSYAASKAGLEMLMDVLRVELKPLGVDVGVAYFSWIDTDMVRGADRYWPGFAALRRELPEPIRRTLPVGAAADAIVRAVEGRRSHVVAPRYVGALRRVRGLLPQIATHDAVRVAAEVDRLTAEMVAERGAFAAGVRSGEPATDAAAHSVGS
jgi:NAD(P)-dependent dehydrogenase (short-subunit alcohol dehydrogenase family)